MQKLPSFCFVFLRRPAAIAGNQSSNNSYEIEFKKGQPTHLNLFAGTFWYWNDRLKSLAIPLEILVPLNEGGDWGTYRKPHLLQVNHTISTIPEIVRYRREPATKVAGTKEKGLKQQQHKRKEKYHASTSK